MGFIKETKNRGNGFTILEIIIVLAIISVLVTITVPRFRGMKEDGKIAKAKNVYITN